MTTIASRIYFWLDGSRLSTYAEEIDVMDERQGITFTPAEAQRIVELPGTASGSFDLRMHTYDVPTATILASYTNATELAYLRTITPAAGGFAELMRVRMLTNVQDFEGGRLDLKRYKFAVSTGSIKTVGVNLYPYTTNITGAGNGSTITVGALSATQSLLVMQHVEAVSGTGNFDAKIVSDPAGTPADAHTFTQVPHTGVPDGQFALVNGPETATDYRYEITAVTGGTWNVQVAVAVIDEL